MIPYIFHASILLAGGFIFYWLLLRRETFFRLNRWVLIAFIGLAFLLPLISIPAAWSIHTPVTVTAGNKSFSVEHPESPAIIADFSNPETTPPSEESSIIASTQKISISRLIPYLYFIGIGVFVITFLVQLFLLWAKIYSLHSVRDGRFRIVELIKDEAPYSFWNTIFINPAKYDPETYNQILKHEKIHIQQAHFIDKLLAELAVIIFWFNPFAWFFRKAITNNLEFLTDQNMLERGVEKRTYQLSLLQVSVPQYPLNLTTNYNQSFLKNRIAMMNQKKSSARSIWKYLFIFPLLFLSMMSLNAIKTTDALNESILEVPETSNTQIDLFTAQIEAIQMDTIPASSELPPLPVFPYTKEEMQEKLAADESFAITLQDAIEEYAEEVEAWKEEVENSRLANVEEPRPSADSEAHPMPDEEPAPAMVIGELLTDPTEIEDPHDELKQTYLYQEKRWKKLPYYKQLALTGKSTEYWNWPTVQKELVAKLLRDGLIQKANKVILGIENGKMMVNGRYASEAMFEKYSNFFEKHEIAVHPRWSYLKHGDYIQILEHAGDLEQLQKKLLKKLKEDGLISSTKEALIIEIPGDKLIINGEEMSWKLFLLMIICSSNIASRPFRVKSSSVIPISWHLV